MQVDTHNTMQTELTAHEVASSGNASACQSVANKVRQDSKTEGMSISQSERLRRLSDCMTVQAQYAAVELDD